jgi:cytochrome P450
VDQTKTLLLAGYETTALGLAWALYLLSRNAEAAARWHEEVDGVLLGRLPSSADLRKLPWTAQIAHETLRLYPPLYTTARQCTEDDEIGGHAIRKGCAVLISIYGIHRSSVWGETPEAFLPERFAPAAGWPKRAFLPFSNGKHICLGNNFAMTEMIVVLAMIGQRYRLQQADDRPIEARGMIGLVPEREIELKLTPR